MAATALITQQPTLEILPPDDFTIRLGRDPKTMIAEAGYCAKQLLAAVKGNGWATNFGGAKDHLWFEAWSFLAAMYRVTPRVRIGDTKYVSFGDTHGFEAVGEAFHVQTNTIVGAATSMCLDDEDNWGMRNVKDWQTGQDGKRERVVVGTKPTPLFQLRSMAETRAMGKALRGPFSWIIAMAGYAATPGEEMGRKGAPAGAAPQPPQQKQADHTQQTSAEGPKKITEPQRKRMWGIAKANNLENETVMSIIKEFGFKQSDDVTMEKYDEIIAAIQQTGGGVPG